MDPSKALLLLVALASSPNWAAAEAGDASKPSRTQARPAEPRRLALGTMGTGGLLRLGLTPRWAGELRVQGASQSSQEGDVRAFVVSARAYRFFTEHYRCKPYLGGEGAYTKTSLSGIQSNTPGANPVLSQSGFGDTSGFAAGVFGGFEYRVLRRVFVDADAGPYAMGLKESRTGTSGSAWDFVLSAAVGVYLF